MSKLWRVIGYNSTEQVLLETSAENVTVADTGGKLEATTVEGALSELADGINGLHSTNIVDVEQGIPTTENGNTITPVTFKFSDGTNKTVNIYAKQGETGATGATGAKITGELPTTGWTMTSEWAESNMPEKRKWNGIAYGNGVFVAAPGNGYWGAYSTDGINWTKINYEILRDRVCVTYGGDKFVALARNSQYGEYSTDGINWHVMTMPKSRIWTNIAYGNGKFVAISDTRYCSYSTDGINWTDMTLPNTDLNKPYERVTYGGDKFVAVSHNNEYGAYSTDGINWTQMSLGATRIWISVTYGNGKFVAIARNSEYGAYSTDGINWYRMTMPFRKLWHDITYGNGMFVAIAEDTNIVAYSTDGINWFTKTLMSTDTWYGVTYGRGKFIAIAFDSSRTAYWDVSKLSYNYSILDSVIKANSTVSMYLNSADEVQAYSKTDGSVVVEMDVVPTQPIPYTLQVVETSTEGSFEIVNSYVPTKTSELENDSGFITASDISTIHVTSVNGQTGAVTIAVPTKTSDLQNDSGFITSSDIPTIPTKTSDLQNDSGFITASDMPTIPTKTSQLTNDSNFATTANIPTKTSQLTNDSGFITVADIPSAGEWVNVVSTSYEDKSLVRKFVFPDLSGDLEGKSVEVVYEPQTYGAYTRVLSFGVISLPKPGTATDTQRTVSGFYLRTGTEETETNPVVCYIQINFNAKNTEHGIQVTAFSSLKGDEQPTIKYRKIN